MQNKFQNFYTNSFPSDEQIKKIWKSKDTIFIFDTNTLLDLYRYRKETQNEFFKQIEKIKSNIWMPYHVGLEFHNNRIKVIKQNKDKKKEIDLLKDIVSIDFKQLSTLQDKYKKTEHPDLYEKIENLKNTLKEHKKEIDKIIETSKKEMKDLLSTDSNFEPHFLAHKDKIIEQISTFFIDNKIGHNLYDSQEKIDTLFQSAQQRWINEIPPGYLDYQEKKDKSFCYDNLKYYNALGDLIIFNEIINISLEQRHIKNILFISNDIKSDWKINIEYEGKKDLGIRPELRNELTSKNKAIEVFEILTTEQFIEKANKITGDIVDQEIIQDVKYSRNNTIDIYRDILPTYRTELCDKFYIKNKFIQEDESSNLAFKLISLTTQLHSLHHQHQKIISKLEKHTNQLVDLESIDLSPNNPEKGLEVMGQKSSIAAQIELLQKQKMHIESEISQTQQNIHNLERYKQQKEDNYIFYLSQ